MAAAWRGGCVVVFLRSYARACWIVGVALTATVAWQSHSVRAAPVDAMTTTGAFEFSFPTEAFPCPLTCGGGVTGTYEGSATGLDVNLRPFTATFAATGNNMTGFATNGEDCTGDPTGELVGSGDADITVTGGTLLDNGVASAGASLFIHLGWWQYGTAMVNLSATQTTLRDSSGSVVQTGFIGGAGQGNMIPVWNPFGIPLSCFDQWPATIYVQGAFVAPA